MHVGWLQDKFQATAPVHVMACPLYTADALTYEAKVVCNQIIHSAMHLLKINSSY